MTLEKFEEKINKKDFIGFIINLFLSLLSISISIFFIYKFSSVTNLKFSFTLVFILFFLSLFLMIGLYGLFELFNPHKIDYFNNNFNKEDNLKLVNEIFQKLEVKEYKMDQQVIEFVFQKNIWSYKNKVYFYADNNLIAFFVETISYNSNGAFLDFGASKRSHKKIFKILMN